MAVNKTSQGKEPLNQQAVEPWVVVLGTAQDGGVPQVGCRRPCCAQPDRPGRRRSPACLAVVDPRSRQRWIIDCTPAFPEQLARLDKATGQDWGLDGVFLTHAHIGHYVGLIHLGREVMGTDGLPVYAMDRMGAFIRGDAPWRHLVENRHIQLRGLESGVRVELAPSLSVTPLLVPHRDEISETVGFRVDGPNKSVLHIPDIDDWDAWDMDLDALLTDVDAAWLDGTFYNADELPHRDLSVIAHPFIEKSMSRFATLSSDIRERIRFTHLNHSNPACETNGPVAAEIRDAGFGIAVEGEHFPL
jgi:pyrroloquinoline quinone biosynthesis protein B